MEKVKSIITYVDELLGKFRRAIVNIFTVILLMIVTLGILGSLESLFQSDEIETEEWECHECSFNVQAGNICPYCDTKKS